jgi:calcineurin-like phosphoesterase
LTALPSRFQVAEDDLRLCAVLIDVEEETGKALSIQRIMRFLPKED